MMTMHFASTRAPKRCVMASTTARGRVGRITGAMRASTRAQAKPSPFEDQSVESLDPELYGILVKEKERQRGGVFSPNASDEGNKSDAFERFVDERDGVRRSARACVRRAAT